MSLQTGDKIGDYEILEVLGAGGMGKVYKVRNLLSDRIEAMKVLLPGLADEPELADRFLREIKVQAAMEHPNIAALRTAQRVDGQVLMIMEYLEGTPLDTLLRDGAIPLGNGLDYVAQVLSALEYAHARGVVHRDLKPGNIMLMPNGVVKLMDFGIAKLSMDRKLTHTGRTIGSLSYMSPEQIQGLANIDARSDLYSLGICLYEIVTGKRPFAADSDYALMVAHLELKPTPPIEVDTSLPASLNEVILMALAKDPAQRFQSAAAFRAALNSVRQEIGAMSAPARPAGAVPAAVTPGPAVNQPLGTVSLPASAVAAAPGTAPLPTTPVMAAAPSVNMPPANAGPLPPTQRLTPPTPSAPPPARGGHRGLYMALGSLATVGVLVAAIIFVPKYLGTRANSRTPAAQTSTRTTSPAAQPSASIPTPASTTPTAPGVVPNLNSTPLQPNAPGEASGNPEPPRVHQHNPRVRTATVAQIPEHPAQQPAQQPPVAQPPAQQTQPQPPRPSAAEMNAVRQQYNQLAIRAGVAKSGLQSLQNQMGGGMTLRADMREAAARVDYLMNEAQASLRTGNLDDARHNLDLADEQVSKIEKFLGR
jgi:eukaryotic-like serine/threonine-protein kinase